MNQRNEKLKKVVISTIATIVIASILLMIYAIPIAGQILFGISVFAFIFSTLINPNILNTFIQAHKINKKNKENNKEKNVINFFQNIINYVLLYPMALNYSLKHLIKILKNRIKFGKDHSSEENNQTENKNNLNKQTVAGDKINGDTFDQEEIYELQPLSNSKNGHDPIDDYEFDQEENDESEALSNSKNGHHPIDDYEFDQEKNDESEAEIRKLFAKSSSLSSATYNTQLSKLQRSIEKAYKM